MQHLPSFFNNERIPSDSLLARVLRADPQDLHAAVSDLSEMERAQLAMFCHARAHLREHGRVIAGTCSRRMLASAGGPAGSAFYDQVMQAGAEPVAETKPLRRPVTVARSARL